MQIEAILTRRNLIVMAVVFVLAIVVGVVIAVEPTAAIVIAFAVLMPLVLISVRNLWAYAIWVAIFGLAVWSYGFNNVPLIRPLPLADALIIFSVIFGFTRWWPLHRVTVVRRLLFFLSALMFIVLLRLIVDIPSFGLLAVRDALFAFELWVLLPAIAMGVMLGERRLNRYLFWLFSITTAWFLLYPWRDVIVSISPVVGIQRPVPLFAFTTAGFLSVPAFFWFLWNRRGMIGVIGAVAALFILLLAQSRGAYLAFLGSVIVLYLLQPGGVKRWGRVMLVGAVVGVVLLLFGSSLTGRLGEPVGIDTVVKQMQTLVGEEGPGAGSFQHRLTAWPMVIRQVLSEPLGPVVGLGLGPDLFQGSIVGPDVLVRKPHNDYLEIWARIGVFGLLAWLGILIVLGLGAAKGARQSPRHGWILALQIMLWITNVGQPAMGFAYVVVVWAGLTGLWIGARLHEQGLVPVKPPRRRGCRLQIREVEENPLVSRRQLQGSP